MDGQLGGTVWERAERATGFVESRPNPGSPSRLVSEARVVADDDAIYVALVYKEVADPDAIVAPLARRDDETTSDWAFVEKSTRVTIAAAASRSASTRAASRWTASGWATCSTTCRGTLSGRRRRGPARVAGRRSSASRSRSWRSCCRPPRSRSSGASTSIAHPHHGESSNWSPRYSGLAGIVSNFNDVIVPAPPTVRRIEESRRRSRARRQSSRLATGRPGRTCASGSGSSASLTATVRPDFGQVEANPSQVNLTAFELFQAERRPFFLEGLDVYRFDTAVALTTRDVSFGMTQPALRGAWAAFRPSSTSPTANGSPVRRRRPESQAPRSSRDRRGAGGSRRRLHGADGGAACHRRRRRGARANRDNRRPDTDQCRAGAAIAPAVRIVGRVFRRRHPSPGHDDPGDGRPGNGRSGRGRRRRRDARRRRPVEWGGWWLVSRSAGSVAAVSRLTDDPAHGFQRPDAPSSWARDRTVLAGGAGAVRISRVAGSAALGRGGTGRDAGFRSQRNRLPVGRGLGRARRHVALRPLSAWPRGSALDGWLREHGARLDLGRHAADAGAEHLWSRGLADLLADEGDRHARRRPRCRRAGCGAGPRYGCPLETPSRCRSCRTSAARRIGRSTREWPAMRTRQRGARPSARC